LEVVYGYEWHIAFVLMLGVCALGYIPLTPFKGGIRECFNFQFVHLQKESRSHLTI
jgi:hypothetical protein